MESNENHIKTTIVPYDDEKSVNEIEQLKLQIVSSSDDNVIKKKKRKVLDEDVYTGQIESIIERDFFPDIPKMRLELDYQDAIEKNDYERISKLARKKLDQQKTKDNQDVQDTPAHFETPDNTHQNEEQKSQKEDKNDMKESQQPKTLTLNKFLNKFTSEDNDSFEQLQEKATQKHMERMEFLNSNSQLINKQVEESLALPSMETQQMIKSESKDDSSSIKLVTWKHSNKNSVMFEPDGVPLTKEEIEKQKSRQVIIHENTRFKSNPFNKLSLPNANPLKLGKIGVDGKEMNNNSTPNVNGFSFVASTPCFRPESLPNSPLMTWGIIEATPINIKGDATPLVHSNSSHFKIPEVPEKEVIGQELANRILGKKRSSQNQSDRTDSPLMKGLQKSSLDRLNSMSPAAQLLATKKLGVHQHMDRSLQASYSPLMTSARTPTPRRIVTPSPSPKRFFPCTPKLIKSPQSSSQKQELTDNNLKRPKASEFF